LSTLVFSSPLPPPLSSTLFPYTTLFRSVVALGWVWGLLKLAVQLVWGTLKGAVTSPLAMLDATARRPGVPWAAFFLLIFWSAIRSEEHTSELQSRGHLVCRLLLEKKNNR